MNQIAVFRKASGLSQGQLAEKLSVTQGAVSQWETGEAKPSLDKLPTLAKLFGCTIDDLFTESAEQKGA